MSSLSDFYQVAEIVNSAISAISIIYHYTNPKSKFVYSSGLSIPSDDIQILEKHIKERKRESFNDCKHHLGFFNNDDKFMRCFLKNPIERDHEHDQQ